MTTIYQVRVLEFCRYGSVCTHLCLYYYYYYYHHYHYHYYHHHLLYAGYYTYIPETNYIPKEYSVAVILLLLFMMLISLLSVLNLLYFYISTFRSMRAVPNMAVFCSSLTSWFPGMLLTYFVNDFEMFPVAPIITGITFVYYCYYYHRHHHYHHQRRLFVVVLLFLP